MRSDNSGLVFALMTEETARSLNGHTSLCCCPETEVLEPYTG